MKKTSYSAKARKQNLKLCNKVFCDFVNLCLRMKLITDVEGKSDTELASQAITLPATELALSRKQLKEYAEQLRRLAAAALVCHIDNAHYIETLEAKLKKLKEKKG